ncbi:MAG TPA: amidohydrolase family protein [Gaiellaceae bacterium]|nr:amidohydrolase family protein [Gaiellaceae bacterium]
MSLLLRNARLAGGEPVDVRVEGGRIAAIGDAQPAEETIDLDGAELRPGFVDTHTHLGWAGAALWRVSWESGGERAALLREVARARSHVADGHWLLGGGFGDGADLPTLAELDVASAGAPALLLSDDQDRGMLNSRAIALLNLEERADVELDDGRVEGRAVRGMAIAGAVPPPDRHRRRGEVASALAVLPRYGVTQVHDIATFPGEPEPPLVYWERSYTDATLFDDLDLPVRVHVRPSLHRRHEFLRLVGTDRIDGLKLFGMGGTGRRIDGVTFRYPGREIATQWVREAHAGGAPVSVHALKAADVAEVLAVFEGVADAPAVAHRLVHAYEVAPGDVDRIARLGLTVEAQPYDTAEAGFRGPWRELLDAGVRVEFGSDWRDANLDAVDPLLAIDIAVEHGLTREESFAAYARRPVAAGGPADLVAFDGDGVLVTVCAGRVTFRSERA